MEGRLFWVLAAAGLLLAVAFILGANIQRSSAENLPSSVRTTSVQRSDIEEVVRANGQVTVRNTDLTFSASGVISDVLVKPGSVVQAGQVLAKLDTREAEANLAGAIAAQKAAQGRLDTIRTGPARELANAQQDLKIAQARLDQIKTGHANPDDLNAAQEAVNGAVFRYNDLVSRPNSQDVAAAEANLRAAQANLANVKAAAPKAQLDQANARLQAAQQNLEKVKSAQDGAVKQADLDLQKATKARDAIKDTYNQLHKQLYNDDGTVKKTTTPADLEREKQAKIALDQAELDLQKAAKALETAKSQQDSATKQAQAQVNEAEASLEDLQSGPSQQAILNAQAQVDKASAELTRARTPASQDEVNAAQADINQAKANQAALTKGGSDKDIAVVQAEVNKYQQLVDQYSKGAAASELDTAEGELQKTTADVTKAQLVIEQASLHAPFNSVVEKVLVTPGQTAAPGVVAFSLVDLSGMSVEARVNQTNIQRIKSGQPIRITFQGINGVRNEPFNGKVTFISFQAKGSPDGSPIVEPTRPTTTSALGGSSSVAVPTLDGGYPVMIVLDRDLQINSLKPGMVGQVTFVLARKTDVLLVPKIAVRTISTGNVVDVVLPDGQLAATPIKAGLVNDDYVELADNTLLREGDKIVLHADTVVPPLPTPTVSPGSGTAVPSLSASGSPAATQSNGTLVTTPSNGTSDGSPAATPSAIPITPLTPGNLPVLGVTPVAISPAPTGAVVSNPALPGTVVIITQRAPTPVAPTITPSTTGTS